MGFLVSMLPKKESYIGVFRYSLVHMTTSLDLLGCSQADVEARRSVFPTGPCRYMPDTLGLKGLLYHDVGAYIYIYTLYIYIYIYMCIYIYISVYVYVCVLHDTWMLLAGGQAFVVVLRGLHGTQEFWFCCCRGFGLLG